MVAANPRLIHMILRDNGKGFLDNKPAYKVWTIRAVLEQTEEELHAIKIEQENALKKKQEKRLEEIKTKKEKQALDALRTDIELAYDPYDKEGTPNYSMHGALGVYFQAPSSKYILTTVKMMIYPADDELFGKKNRNLKNQCYIKIYNRKMGLIASYPFMAKDIPSDKVWWNFPIPNLKVPMGFLVVLDFDENKGV